MPLFTKILLKTKLSGNVLPDEVDKREIVFGDDEKCFFIKSYKTGELVRFGRIADDAVSTKSAWSSVQILNAINEYGSSPSGVSDRVIGDILSGEKDNINLIFNTSKEFRPLTLEIFLNGIRLCPNLDYFINNGNTSITLSEPLLDEDHVLIANYYTSEDYSGPEPVVGEIPTGEIDGVNLEFYTAEHFLPFTLEVFLNGQRLTNNLDYTVNNDLSMFTTNFPVLEDEILVVNYYKLAASSGSGGFGDGDNFTSIPENTVVYLVPKLIDCGDIDNGEFTMEAYDDLDNYHRVVSVGVPDEIDGGDIVDYVNGIVYDDLDGGNVE